MSIVFFISGASRYKPDSSMKGEPATNIACHPGKPAKVERLKTVIYACGCFGIGPTLQLIEPFEKKYNNVITVVPASKKGNKLEKG